ncbi:LacI family DNA-binding transcriptional regulator [Arthrobacter sp. FX8]|uniref:LacI family DNA-binding transcriptional regulator n=1 Tax=Micrococcaceae TaxID=1268 RepID=UPI00036725DB|nr:MULTISPECIES: LacI family DNA-binding transcriptional regulator [unclassified Arthrobacter]KRE70699.1 LacI family transcriptional regulator [Arthrobacter sp. Soil761]WAJ33584.1 LacI family DNA-binding transcriptional regulator [Arthrobacter sp. FX8]BCW53377.1 LacI family transcriptional regulator [Arthrobacter sp. StoSoilB19]BCW74462.1 LacI family transcriptional regulator [Arthrobacter sp. NicSoilB11]
MTHGKPRRLPRLEDVAELAGVSHQTVSRVVNNHPNVSPGTREKVEAVIARLGYRRNTAARSLVTRRSQTIGVLGSELSQYGPANTLLGVERAARDAGYFVSVAALREVSRDAILDAVRHFLDQSVDGIVVIVPHLETLAALAELPIGVPVVAVGPEGNDTVGGVRVDQRRGAELAVRHLIGQGHVRIGHVAGPQDWIDAVARADGWRSTLASAGLEADLIIEGDWSAGSGYAIGRRIAATRRATALFVGNDQMALGVLRALTEAGIKVPQDVSVVGFDDQPEAGYFSPPLTVVRQDFEELGRRCMQMMLTAFSGAEGPRTLVVEPELVLRSSTAPPA